MARPVDAARSSAGRNLTLSMLRAVHDGRYDLDGRRIGHEDLARAQAGEVADPKAAPLHHLRALRGRGAGRRDAERQLNFSGQVGHRVGHLAVHPDLEVEVRTKTEPSEVADPDHLPLADVLAVRDGDRLLV